MKLNRFWPYLVLTGCLLILIPSSSLASTRALDFSFEYQDPAGDVLKYNATENGLTIDDPAFDSLDIKWIFSVSDNKGNVIITIDLKSKCNFLNEDETKYVVRLLTSEDNSEGYNITYCNETTIFNSFSPQGNGTKIDISPNITFVRDKGNEMMVIKVSIEDYLDQISHYNMDAYSIKTLDDGIYLDYIGELPGHPDYVDPSVVEGENIDGNSEDDSGNIISNSVMVLGLAIGIVVIVMITIVVLVRMAKKRRQD